MVPSTFMGRLSSIICANIGILAIALPIPEIIDRFMRNQEHQETMVCSITWKRSFLNVLSRQMGMCEACYARNSFILLMLTRVQNLCKIILKKEQRIKLNFRGWSLNKKIQSSSSLTVLMILFFKLFWLASYLFLKLSKSIYRSEYL